MYLIISCLHRAVTQQKRTYFWSVEEQKHRKTALNKDSVLLYSRHTTSKRVLTPCKVFHCAISIIISPKGLAVVLICQNKLAPCMFSLAFFFSLAPVPSTSSGICSLIFVACWYGDAVYNPHRDTEGVGCVEPSAVNAMTPAVL